MSVKVDRRSAEPIRALVVDDNRDNRELYAQYLRFCGALVETAETGLEAIEKAPMFKPTIIVMDMAMPGMDGWRATQRLKAQKRTAHIIVIAVTSDAFTGAGQKAKDAGCDGYLSKPCLPQDLVHEIRRLLPARAWNLQAPHVAPARPKSEP